MVAPRHPSEHPLKITSVRLQVNRQLSSINKYSSGSP
jgi:hypothetical protein